MVVLPQPDGPKSVVKVPSSKLRSTCLTACTSPKDLAMPFNSTAAIVIP